MRRYEGDGALDGLSIGRPHFERDAAINRGTRSDLGQVGVLPIEIREDGRPIGGKLAQDSAELMGLGLSHGGKSSTQPESVTIERESNGEVGNPRARAPRRILYRP